VRSLTHEICIAGSLNTLLPLLLPLPLPPSSGPTVGPRSRTESRIDEMTLAEMIQQVGSERRQTIGYVNVPKTCWYEKLYTVGLSATRAVRIGLSATRAVRIGLSATRAVRIGIGLL